MFALITLKAHNTSAWSSNASDMPNLEETTTDDELMMSDDEGESSDKAGPPCKAYTGRNHHMQPVQLRQCRGLHGNEGCGMAQLPVRTRA